MYQPPPMYPQYVTRKYQNAKAYHADAHALAKHGFVHYSQDQYGVTWVRQVPMGANPPIPAQVAGGPRLGLFVGIVAAVIVVIVLASVGSHSASTTATGTVAASSQFSAANPTPILVGTLASQDVLAAYHTIDVRELKKNPDAHKGEKVQMTGEVFNIKTSGNRNYLQIWVRTPGGTQYDREAVVINYIGATDGIYEKTYVTIYGVAAGASDGKNAFGASLNQPLVNADRLEVTKSPV